MTLGQETIITPVYCQLDMNHCHVMTDTLARYTLLGESIPSGKPTKILRLAAFAPMMPSSIDYSIRVYIVEDTQDALSVSSFLNIKYNPLEKYWKCYGKVGKM